MEFDFYRIIRTAIVKMTFFEMFVVLHRVFKKGGNSASFDKRYNIEEEVF
jgi:hypothetical protein